MTAPYPEKLRQVTRRIFDEHLEELGNWLDAYSPSLNEEEIKQMFRFLLAAEMANPESDGLVERFVNLDPKGRNF